MNTTLQYLTLLTLLFPLIVVVLTAIIVLLLGRKYPNVIGYLLSAITFISSLILLIISIWMLFVEQQNASVDWVINFHIGAFNIVKMTLNFRVDALSIFMILLINVVAFAASWNSIAYLAGTPSSTEKPWWQQKVGFHVLINLFHFTMLLVPLANNLVVVWIAIELTTVGSAILIVYEGKKSSWEATWKYLIITSTGIVLALLGTIFLATNNVPNLNPAYPEQRLEWTFLVENASKLKPQPQLVWFAFLFALVGYGTKAGLAPLHTWLPDGHGEAPAPISALLSGVLLKASFYVILRFYVLTNAVLEDTHPGWTSYALLIAGVFSLLVATPFILKKNSFKRVLAYHSLEHMGIIAFGFGIGGPIAIAGALLHMLNHAITKALMFLSYGNITKNYEKANLPITGILRAMPWNGGLLTLGGLALVGTPPFNIFMSELIILWGALSRFIPVKSPVQPNYPTWIAGVAVSIFVISTTLIFFGLVNHLKNQVLGKTEKADLNEHFTLTWPSISSIVPILFLFTLMLLLGFWIFPTLASLVHESVNIVLCSPCIKE